MSETSSLKFSQRTMVPSFSKWTQSNFGHIKYMHPKVQRLYREFFLRLAMDGIYFRIDDTGGKRTPEDQINLYNKRPRVTWVLCPHSMHCPGLAVDIIPMKRLGTIYYEPIWTAPIYDQIARIAMDLGLEGGFAIWGVDKPHFHYRGNKTLEEISNGERPDEPVFKISEKDNSTLRVMSRLKIAPDLTTLYTRC